MNNFLYDNANVARYVQTVFQKNRAKNARTKLSKLSDFLNWLETNYRISEESNEFFISLLNKEDTINAYTIYINTLPISNKKEKLREIRNFFEYFKKKKLVSEEIFLRTKELLSLQKDDSEEIPKYFKEYLTWIQVRILLRKATLKFPTCNPYKLNALVMLVYCSGIRTKELLEIKRKDINFKEGIIQTSKRQIAFPLHIIPQILRYFDSDPERINAFNLDGPEVEKINRALLSYTKKNVKINLHTLRKFFIINCIIKGYSAEDIARLIGFKAEAHIKKYRQILSKKTLREIYDEQLGRSHHAISKKNRN